MLFRSITFLHVTHSQQEAMAVADLVVVMNSGRIDQAGPPREIYNEPKSDFVARFIGGHNVLSGRLRPTEDSGFELETDNGIVFRATSRDPVTAGAATVALRSDKISLAAAVTVETTANSFVAEVSAITDTLAHQRIEVEDVGVAAVRFKNGAVGTITCTTSAWPNLLSLTLTLFICM